MTKNILHQSHASATTKATAIDNVRAVRALVLRFGKVMAQSNNVVAQMSLIASRGDLSASHKERLGALYAELLSARREFDEKVVALPSKAQADSRLSDARNALQQVTERCRSLI